MEQTLIYAWQTEPVLLLRLVLTDMIAQFNYYLAMEQTLIHARKNGAGPLYEACHNGHDSIVRLLLSNGANINSCMEGDAGPLFKLVKTDIQRALYNCY